jgi:hypothetical protein
MKNNIFKLALGLSFSLTALTASAQKNYTEGVVTYTTTSAAGSTETKVSFRGDSSYAAIESPPAFIKLITTTKHTYFAVLVDVPLASIKKAAVLTPDELDQASEETPKFTFTPTTETKQISGYNCKKVVAKDAKTGTSAEVWVTNDITIPGNYLTLAFANAGGTPVQITGSGQGQQGTITIKSITEQKIPAGTFGVPAGYDRITYDELNQMRKR